MSESRERESLEPATTKEQRISTRMPCDPDGVSDPHDAVVALLRPSGPGTERLPPPTALLSRVAAFLPQIASANKELKEAVEKDPHAAAKHNMEELSGDAGPVIEMRLGVGLYDVVPGAERVLAAPSHVLPADGTVETLEDNEDSEGEYDDEGTDTSSLDNSVPAATTAGRRRGIEVLSQTDSSDSSANGEEDSSSDSGHSADEHSVASEGKAAPKRASEGQARDAAGE